MSNKLLIKTFLIALTIIGSTSSAAIFVWTDAEGKKHYSDRKPEIDNEFEDITKLIKTHRSTKNRSSTSVASRSDYGSSKKSGDGPTCGETYSQCAAKVKSSYNSQSMNCRGNWRPGASNTTPQLTDQGSFSSCLEQAQDERDTSMNSCQRTQSMCLAQR